MTESCGYFANPAARELPVGWFGWEMHSGRQQEAALSVYKWLEEGMGSLNIGLGTFGLKNLIKLQTSGYIALEPLECTYKAYNLIENNCAHTMSDHKQPMAIVILHKQHFHHHLATNRLFGIDLNTSVNLGTGL
ncbi:hypothetical protein BDQ12DRAFT_669625 [Crucibulum laeve]|uniref:Uncharacterized protein n=1 Tax=Crucibulum laeve TaxID=68775 RepID=A0A5C3LPI3_9AGAR|nr:hypothetical protein BDQ12DRAFT_669625 [Crucibulum laeve]